MVKSYDFKMLQITFLRFIKVPSGKTSPKINYCSSNSKPLKSFNKSWKLQAMYKIIGQSLD